MRRIETNPDRINWFRVLADLQKAGMSVTAASAAIQASRTTVLGWRQGSEPKHSDGERLIRLWMQELGCYREDAPKVGKLGTQA